MEPIRVTIEHDCGPETAMEEICGVLRSLGVPYKIEESDASMTIVYQKEPRP